MGDDQASVHRGRFTHVNESFQCEACGHLVPALVGGGCRNHCPRCLTSKHVDVFPGDRGNPCEGLMVAIDYDLTKGKGLVLIFRCSKCGAQTRNVAAHEDKGAPDDYDRILGLKSR